MLRYCNITLTVENLIFAKCNRYHMCFQYSWIVVQRSIILCDVFRVDKNLTSFFKKILATVKKRRVEVE